MVSNQIVDSDNFLDMPLSAQALYLHMLVRADDEGFLNSVKKVMRIIRASDDDLKVLIGKNFVILFESGVLVIKHWLIHNTIRKDRVIPTAHIDEREQLEIKDNNAYTFKDNKTIKIDDGHMSDKRQPSDRIEEISLEEYRLDKISLEEYRQPDGHLSVKPDTTNTNSSNIDYDDILNYWNKHSGLNSIRTITDKRKKFVKIRVKNHGIDAIYTVIDNCRLSSFMKGDNNRNWIATFDWVFGNPNNFLKVLEGNYVNENHNPSKSNSMQDRANRLKEKYGDQHES